MRAYVIKNKEGKYFCGFDYFAGIDIFSERIIDGLNTQTPTLKHCREEIKDFDLKDCEPVKITIAEGDLQKENEVLRRALELACDELDTWHRSCDNRPDYFMQQAKEQRDEQV